jgi:hypothetical protein
MKLRAIRDNILCTDGDFGDKVTASGLIVKSTIGKSEGIVPRWFRVFEVGSDIDWIKPGQWVYVEYGRWTDGIEVQDDRFNTPENKKKIWKVDPNACLLVSDEEPNLQEIVINTDAVSAIKKSFEY